MCPLYALFIILSLHFCPLQTLQKPLAQQMCCTSDFIQSTSIPGFLVSIHFTPCILYEPISPPFPVDPLGTLQIQRQRIMWLEVDRYECIFCTVLYNDTYITCLQQWQSAILALYNTTALLKRKRKKKSRCQPGHRGTCFEISSCTWSSGTWHPVIWSLTSGDLVDCRKRFA